MTILQEKTRIFLITIFTFAGMFLNSTEIIADGKVLFQKNFDVNNNEKLVVKMSSADIDVTGWDNEEVEVIIEGSEKVNKYFDFSFSYENGVVEVVGEKQSNWSSWTNWSWSKDFKVKVKVPREFMLDMKTSGGDMEIKMVNGKIELKTSGGDIEIKNSEGSLMAKTSGGDIELTNFIGNTELKTSGGDIDVKHLEGSVEAKTSGGDVELSVSNGQVSAGTSGGGISLNYEGNNEGIELKTSGGSISVKLPSDFKADVYLKTSGGSVKNKFANSSPSEITKSKFEGKYNNGGVSFSAKTSGGSISVSQK